MQTVRTLVLRCAVLALVLSLALAFPKSANADLLGGLSIRAGGYFTTAGNVRDVAGFGAPGIGLAYELPWIPRLFNAENWSSSISVDFHYRDWELHLREGDDAHVFRYLATSINQVYRFEEQDRVTPYLGFAITAATFNNSRGAITRRQPTVTRFGGGLIVGADLAGTHMYLEGRYEMFFRGHAAYVPDGFRAYMGYRF